MYVVYSPAAEDVLWLDEAEDELFSLSFWPILMLLLVRLFHCLSCATVTPCLVAIPERVSPDLTVYVPVGAGLWLPEAADDELVEAEDELLEGPPPL